MTRPKYETKRECWEFGPGYPLTNRNSPPVERVRAALWRLSRDKWLPPVEVIRVALAMSYRAAPDSRLLYEKSMPMLSQTTGLMRGRTPVDKGNSYLHQFAQAIKNMSKRDLKSPELFILNLTLKGISNGRL